MSSLQLTLICLVLCYIQVLGQDTINVDTKSLLPRYLQSTSSAPTSVGKPSPSPVAKKVSYAYFTIAQKFVHVYNNAFDVSLSTKVLDLTLQNLTVSDNLPGSLYVNISSAMYELLGSGIPGNATVYYNITYPFPLGTDYVYYYFQISNTISNSLKNKAFNKVFNSYCAQLQSGLLYSKALPVIEFSDPALFVPHKFHNGTVGTGTGSGASTSSSSSSSSPASSLDTTSVIVIAVLAAASLCAIVAAVLAYLMRRKRTLEETKQAIAKELGGFADIYGRKMEEGQVWKKLYKGKVCEVCNEKIRPHHETVELEDNIFHKDCASCEECDCDLVADTFTQHRQGKTLILLCKPHYSAKFPGTEYTAQKKSEPVDAASASNPMTSDAPADSKPEEAAKEGAGGAPSTTEADSVPVAIRKKTVVAQTPSPSTFKKESVKSEFGGGLLSWLGFSRTKPTKKAGEEPDDEAESESNAKRSKRKEKLAKKVRDSNQEDGLEDDDTEETARPKFPNPYFPYPDPMTGTPGYGQYGPGAFRTPYAPPYFGAPPIPMPMPIPGDPYSAVDPYIMQLARARAAEAEAKRIADEMELKRLAEQAEIKRRAREEELRIQAEEEERSRIQQEKIRAAQEKQRQEAAAEVQRMFQAAEKERLAQEAEVKKLAQQIVAQRIAEEEEAMMRAQEEERVRLAYEEQLKRELNEQYERKRIAFEKAFDRKVQSDEEKRRAEYQRRKELEDAASRRALEERARARALEANEARQRMAGMMNDIGSIDKPGPPPNDRNRRVRRYISC